jgi:hypothetical protein
LLLWLELGATLNLETQRVKRRGDARVKRELRVAIGRRTHKSESSLTSFEIGVDCELRLQSPFMAPLGVRGTAAGKLR